MDNRTDNALKTRNKRVRRISREVEETMLSMADEDQARHLMRFFKCGPGQYGEGDRFLGIRCPATRSVVKEARGLATTDDAVELILSPWHEIRLAGFLLLIELFKKALKKKDDNLAEKYVLTYLNLISFGNNWDLVDLVAPKILGVWLVGHPENIGILYQLAECEDSLWHQRVAIVTTWTLIREGRFDDTFRLAERFLNHPHDLIHKATGWMLREVGKRGGREELIEFLDRNATRMPRTALRYSIEHFPEDLRRHYLSLR